jgi:hypothetical protein
VIPLRLFQSQANHSPVTSKSFEVGSKIEAEEAVTGLTEGKAVEPENSKRKRELVDVVSNRPVKQLVTSTSKSTPSRGRRQPVGTSRSAIYSQRLKEKIDKGTFVADPAKQAKWQQRIRTLDEHAEFYDDDVFCDCRQRAWSPALVYPSRSVSQPSFLQGVLVPECLRSPSSSQIMTRHLRHQNPLSHRRGHAQGSTKSRSLR